MILAFGLCACSEFAEGVPKAQLGPLVRTGTVALEPLPQTLPGLRPIALGPEALSIQFEAAKLTGRHQGSFKRMSGRLDWSPDEPERSRLFIDVETDSVETDAPKLTKHLKSPDFFGVETYPKARLVLDLLHPEAPGQFEAEGRLQLHGIERSIRIPVQIQAESGRLRGTSSFVLDRKAFGIVYAGRPDDLIASEVVLRVELEARSSP